MAVSLRENTKSMKESKKVSENHNHCEGVWKARKNTEDIYDYCLAIGPKIVKLYTDKMNRMARYLFFLPTAFEGNG